MRWDVAYDILIKKYKLMIKIVPYKIQFFLYMLYEPRNAYK